MSEHAELLERFRRGAELLAFAMTGAAGPELDYKPAPDKWSVRQLVCHLADTETILAVRIRQVIAEENPTLQGVDQNAWAEKLGYSKRKPSHIIDTFRRTRSDNYELLNEQSEEAFARSGMHTERGPVTLLDLVRTYAAHAENHILQIRAARAAYKEAKAKAV